MTRPPADESIRRLLHDLRGMPLFLGGSAVAEEQYNLTDAHDDCDLFAASGEALVAGVQHLLDLGYQLEEKHVRLWARWMRFGFKTWHTNSIKLESPHGAHVNMVFKLVDGHPTTSLSQVLESFDFGLLGSGYDVSDGSYHDLRPYLFPGMDVKGPLPLMPNKREAWRNGFISQYNGIREAGRYAKYATYGYDLSLVKDDLLTGYYQAADYLQGRDQPDKQMLGQIYQVIAVKIETDAIDELLEAGREIIVLDSLDEIMEHLE